MSQTTALSRDFWWGINRAKTEVAIQFNSPRAREYAESQGWGHSLKLPIREGVETVTMLQEKNFRPLRIHYSK